MKLMGIINLRSILFNNFTLFISLREMGVKLCKWCLKDLDTLTDGLMVCSMILNNFFKCDLLKGVFLPAFTLKTQKCEIPLCRVKFFLKNIKALYFLY